jgi:hypothetical protein
MDGLAETIMAVKTRLDGLDIMALLHNPYFLVGSTVFCGVALVRRMFNALVLFLATIALAVLFHYTVPQHSAELETQSLLYFAGGGIVILGAVIYFVFIRSE